jgi:hypothetical protein
VEIYRDRAGRHGTGDRGDTFEFLTVALYDWDGPDRGSVGFFDVELDPPEGGRPDPSQLLTFEGFIERILKVYRDRFERRPRR